MGEHEDNWARQTGKGKRRYVAGDLRHCPLQDALCLSQKLNAIRIIETRLIPLIYRELENLGVKLKLRYILKKLYYLMLVK